MGRSNLKGFFAFFLVLVLFSSQIQGISSSITPPLITLNPEGLEDESLFLVRNDNTKDVEITITSDKPELISFPQGTNFKLGVNQTKEVPFSIVLKEAKTETININVFTENEDGGLGQTIVVTVNKDDKQDDSVYYIIGGVLLMILLFLFLKLINKRNGGKNNG